MSEIELKFGLTEAAADAVGAILLGRGATTEELESRYWDSADRRLARAGISLRLRRSSTGWDQTVKAEGASPAERMEETVARAGRWDGGAPPPDTRLHAGSQAGERLNEALSKRSGKPAPLGLVHTTRVRRFALSIEVSGADLEVALDRGTVDSSERSLPILELEVELKEGPVAPLIAVGRASLDAHGMWLSTISKAMRGGWLAKLPDPPRAVKAERVQLDRHASGPEIFRAVMRNCVDQVLANAGLLAEGNLEDAVLHQLRIGLRRMRTARRELGMWRGALGDEWQAAADDAFRKLGVYRDHRTIAASMQRRLAAAGSPNPVLRTGSAAEDYDPTRIVRDRAFQNSMLSLLEFLLDAPALARTGPASGDGEPTERDGSAGDPARVVARRLGKLHERLKRDAQEFEKLGTRSRHGVRKRLKRLRYLSELVAPLYRRGRVERFLDEIEPGQDELGRYIDLVVAIRFAEETAETGDPRAWFNVGWLRAQVPRAVERCSKCLRRVDDAEPFWS